LATQAEYNLVAFQEVSLEFRWASRPSSIHCSSIVHLLFAYRNLSSKLKNHDIAILDDIIFPFHAYFANLASFAPTAEIYEIFPVSNIGLDEFFFKIGMDDPCSLRRSPSFMDGPGMDFHFPSRKIILESECIVTRFDKLIGWIFEDAHRS
jgi:hypothetical protein